MTQIQYPNDITGSIQIAHGSDGRLNTSSRSDGRSYYNSRDQGQTYSVVFDDADADLADEAFFWLKNDSTDKTLVLDTIGISALLTGAFLLQFETATLTGGVALTPVNLNKSSSNLAVVTCRGNGALATVSADGSIDMFAIGAAEHEEFHLNDRVRLGQGDAISISYDRGADNNILEGVVYFYFE